MKEKFHNNLACLIQGHVFVSKRDTFCDINRAWAKLNDYHLACVQCRSEFIFNGEIFNLTQRSSSFLEFRRSISTSPCKKIITVNEHKWEFFGEIKWI